MTVEGYLIDVDYDGHRLHVHGRNKAARIALAGADHTSDVDIPREAIERVEFRNANPVTNGTLTVHTRDGRTYRLHFRRKQREPFEQLADALSGPA